MRRPVEQPTKFDLVVPPHREGARPETFLVRADEVIE
jgi:hypothetical protein